MATKTVNQKGKEKCELTREQLAILKYVTTRSSRPGEYCGGGEAMDGLVELGLMRSIGKASWCPDEFFRITEAGRQAIRSPGTK
jgi:hypothetical protein